MKRTELFLSMRREVKKAEGKEGSQQSTAREKAVITYSYLLSAVKDLEFPLAANE